MLRDKKWFSSTIIRRSLLTFSFHSLKQASCDATFSDFFSGFYGSEKLNNSEKRLNISMCLQRLRKRHLSSSILKSQYLLFSWYGISRFQDVSLWWTTIIYDSLTYLSIHILILGKCFLSKQVFLRNGQTSVNSTMMQSSQTELNASAFHHQTTGISTPFFRKIVPFPFYLLKGGWHHLIISLLTYSHLKSFEVSQ